MSNDWLQVVYADMLSASQTFTTQGKDFRAITANASWIFRADDNVNPDNSTDIYLAIEGFLMTLDVAQQAIAEGMQGHGVKLKLAHDTYDRGETAAKMSAQSLLQVLADPDIIQ